jgi:hypothetical protein
MVVLTRAWNPRQSARFAIKRCNRQQHYSGYDGRINYLLKEYLIE